MKELSLFSGAGGGCLGSKILGHQIVGYIEYENYCQEIIKQRIADGILDPAPIFGDIRKFVSEGWAGRYRGKVDLVSGGFPCQPFSVAGKRAGENDPRNMWPATIEVIRAIRPRFAFLENVPGLLADKYMGRIFGDLSEAGYDFKWTVLGAGDVGAVHLRERLWIFAWDTNGTINDKCAVGEIQARGKSTDSERVCQEISNHKSSGLPSCTVKEFNGEPGGGLEGQQFGRVRVQDRGWWEVEPRLGRVAHGVAHRVDRLKSIGNGQVPLCMAYAFSVLSQGIVE